MNSSFFIKLSLELEQKSALLFAMTGSCDLFAIKSARVHGLDFFHVNALRYFTDPLGLIEDAPICNAGVFRDLTQYGDAK